ncbi:hypothetical protein [Streptomyces werraensis]|uniref:hypothetical protein n=1 Tax=Streptomyces werraensis TaxID=68284 RepID=UPI003817DBE7
MATAIITEAVMTQLRGPAAEIAVSVAVAAGGLWAAQGRARQKSAVAMGATAQALTWQPHAGRRHRPSDGETYRHFAARMRQTTEHVRRTTAERGLEKVTLATSDETTADTVYDRTLIKPEDDPLSKVPLGGHTDPA